MGRGKRLTRTPEQVAAFKSVLERTGVVQDALIAAGYSETVAKRGKASIPESLMGAYAASSKKFIALGRELSAQDQEALVRGRLLSNAIDGKDSAVNSLKLLGQDKRVNMFVADSIAGVVVIEAPRALPQADNLPVLDGEIVETPKQLKE